MVQIPLEISYSKVQLLFCDSHTLTLQVSKAVSTLPFTVTLEKFQVEYYDRMQRVPKKFRSELILQNKECRLYTAIEVNEPVDFGGYSIYQDNYDREKGLYSVLLLVRDPWLGIVYTGILMMIIGAVGLVVCGPLRKPNQ